MTWTKISGFMGAVVLVAAFIAALNGYTWAFPAPIWYVESTKKELQDYVLKQVGELKPVLNTLVKNQLVRDRRDEETRRSAIEDKVEKAQREIETADSPRTRELLKESIARALQDREATERSIRRLTEQIQAIPAN